LGCGGRLVTKLGERRERAGANYGGKAFVRCMKRVGTVQISLVSGGVALSGNHQNPCVTTHRKKKRVPIHEHLHE
jgi:hypothetical protein